MELGGLGRSIGIWGSADGTDREFVSEFAGNATRRLFSLRTDETGRVAVHYLLAAVACDYVSGEPVADDDVIAARWVALDDIASGTLDLHPGVQDVAEMALRRLRDRNR